MISTAFFTALPNADWRLSYSVYFPPAAQAARTNQRLRKIQMASAGDGSELVPNEDRLTRMGDAARFAVELSETRARVAQYCLQITLWADSPEASARAAHQAQNNLQSVGASWRLFAETGTQADAAHRTLLGGVAKATQWMQTTSSAALAMLPLFTTPRGDEPVVDFRDVTGAPFGFHPMEPQRVNWNTIITGASGSGKSFLTNRLLAAQLAIGGRVVLIDHAGEQASGYVPFIDALGDRARYISVLEGGRRFIRSRPRQRAVTDAGTVRPDALKTVVRVVDLLCANTAAGKDEGLYRAVIQDAVAAVYAETSPRADLWGLQAALGVQRDERAHTLARLLNAVLNGAYGQFFGTVDDETPSDDYDLVVFDLFGIGALPKEVADAIVYLATDYAARVAFATGADTPSFVVIDEVAQLMTNPLLGELLSELFRTARKWRSGVTAISQTWRAIAQQAPEAAATIASNALTQFFLWTGSDAAEIEAIARDWGLAPHEAEALRCVRTVKGQFASMLLRTQLDGRDLYSAPVFYRPAPEELVLWSSDPLDRQRLRLWRARNPETPLMALVDAIVAEGAAA